MDVSSQIGHLEVSKVNWILNRRCGICESAWVGWKVIEGGSWIKLPIE